MPTPKRLRDKAYMAQKPASGEPVNGRCWPTGRPVARSCTALPPVPLLPLPGLHESGVRFHIS